MVDPRKAEPRDYFSRREQWRLLLLVMSLGLVIFLMNEVRKPQYWQWLFPKHAAEAGAKSERKGDSQTAPVEPVRKPDAKTPPSRRPGATDVTDSVSPDASGRYFPGVDPRLLGATQDKSRFRSQEQGAWFQLFRVLENANPAELKRWSIGRISRVQLLEQSKAYRGKLVTICGTVKRAHWIKAPKNDVGVTGYYQLWISPDNNPRWPIVVYSLTVPEGFPTGMTIAEQATLTGFYFKQWLCGAKEGIELVPVVLAADIHWRPATGFLDEAPLGPGSLVVVGVGALVLAVVIVSYVYRRTRRAKRTLPATIEFPAEDQSDD